MYFETICEKLTSFPGNCSGTVVVKAKKVPEKVCLKQCVADPGRSSQIPDTKFSIPDPGSKRSRIRISRWKNSSIFNPKNCFWSLWYMIRDVRPGSRSWLFYSSQIPESKRHRIPYPQHWFRGLKMNLPLPERCPGPLWRTPPAAQGASHPWRARRWGNAPIRAGFPPWRSWQPAGYAPRPQPVHCCCWWC